MGWLRLRLKNNFYSIAISLEVVKKQDSIQTVSR